MMERKLTIVSFGDVIGFGPWIKRAMNNHEIQQSFMAEFFSALELFISRNNIYLKYIGDGIMVLKELSMDKSRVSETMKFLEDISELNDRMHHIIKKCDWPAPHGFRSRVVVGYAHKFMAACPIRSRCSAMGTCKKGDKCSVEHGLKIPEYIGYAVNLAERLLSIHPEIPLMCHESVLHITGMKRKGIKFHHLKNIKDQRGGVDPEDLEGLYSFELVSSRS